MSFLSWWEAVAFLALVGSQLFVVLLVIRCCRSRRNGAVAVSMKVSKDRSCEACGLW